MGAWALENAFPGGISNWDADNTTDTGPRIVPASAGFVTAIRYWRDGTTRSAPDQCAVFNDTLGSIVAGPLTPTDDGTVGWQVTQLPEPVAFSANNQLRAAFHWNSGGGHGYRTTSGSAPKGPPGIALTANFSFSVADSSIHYSGSGGSLLNVFALDLYVEWGPGGDASYPGLSQTDLDAAFERWLTTTGSRYDGNAIQLQREVVDANNAGINGLLDRVPEAFATEWATVRDTIGAWLTTEADWYRKLVHDTAPGAASLLDKVGDYTGITVFAYLADLIRWANGINAPPQLADTTDWQLVDETDFTDNLLWPVEADVYRVTLSSFDPAGTSEPVGTETRHAYLGKWCPFNVQFSSEWHYFNTASADLSVGGRMPGLGLILYRPGAGHVQAWRRTEAP